MKIQPRMTALAAVLLLSACAVPSVGDKQADTPPRIVVRDNVTYWDDVGRFGPVPAELTASAQKVCGSLNRDGVEYVAEGYHAKAEDVNGKPFPNGGYYCVRKK